MRQTFKDAEHLLRFAGLFAVGIAAFFALRAAFIPKGFGELGHYRAGALEDNRQRLPRFAGAAACGDCHDDVRQTLRTGKHAGVHCEACHGPLAPHAADPIATAAKRPDPLSLCPVCHQKNVARPAAFPQVDAAEHAGGSSCTECHVAHNPGLE